MGSLPEGKLTQQFVCAGLCSCQRVFSNASVEASLAQRGAILPRVKDALLGFFSGMPFPEVSKTWEIVL